MTKIFLKGSEVNTIGPLPAKGSLGKDFKLTKNDLTPSTLSDFDGKRKILNIFPSLDTPVCALSVKKFNQQSSKLNNVVILNISADLPFAQKRFCAVEGLENALTLSTFRSTFPNDYMVRIIDSPLEGLCSRAIIILNEKNEVIYTEQVSEIANEPDYDKALNALKN